MKNLLVLTMVVFCFIGVTFGEGVTVIVHGFNAGTPDWTDEMASAIISEFSLDASICHLEFYSSSVTPGHIVLFYSWSGVDIGDSASGEFLVILDWSGADNLFVSTSQIAELTVGKLLSSSFCLSSGKPLVELPIHLIGYSRGASVISEISRLLGGEGIMVDHMTSLDSQISVPSGDSDVLVYGNVLFADNYWQELGSLEGEAIAGAYNRELTYLNFGYDNPHSDVHLWYHGTIEDDNPVVDGHEITPGMRLTWWDFSENYGETAGYYYSRIGGGDRLSNAYSSTSSGYGIAYGGDGGREAVDSSNAIWPNVYDLSIEFGDVPIVGESCYLLVGDILELKADVKVFGNGSVDFYFDVDRNPYNGNGPWIGEEAFSFGAVYRVHEWDTSDVSFGAEGYVCAKVSDGSRDRYFYAKSKLVFKGCEPDINRDGIVDFLDYSILASYWMSSCSYPSWCSGADLDCSEFVDIGDVEIMSGYWLRGRRLEPGAMTWVYVYDPGFVGEMSKYETTNAQYCDFLNVALASGDIYVDGNRVYGRGGSNVGEDFVDECYFDTYELSSYSQISYVGGAFNVRTRDGNDMSDYPVVRVSWCGATAFCNYFGYRLPTEWEWQAVADYDGSYVYGCGATIDHGKANYDGYNPLGLSSQPYTSSVGYYGSFGYGLCDMAGNVMEWTSSATGDRFVIRGGSWATVSSFCNVLNRNLTGLPDYTGSFYLGFRVCR